MLRSCENIAREDRLLRPVDDQRREVDALFSVEPTATGAYVIIESRGGADGGPKPARNKDYARGLELLLQRLGAEGAILTEVEVYSRVTREWPETQRRLSAPRFPLPIDLSAMTEHQAFRHELGRASTALGRKPGATGGNPTKKLRLTLEWPAAVGRSAAELEDRLAQLGSS